MSTRAVTLSQILDSRLDSPDRGAEHASSRAPSPSARSDSRDFFTKSSPGGFSTSSPASRIRYATGETGEVGRKAARKDVREISDAYRDVDAFIQTPEFLDFMSDVTGIPDLMYDPEYHGGGRMKSRRGGPLHARRLQLPPRRAGTAG